MVGQNFLRKFRTLKRTQVCHFGLFGFLKIDSNFAGIGYDEVSVESW